MAATPGRRGVAGGGPGPDQDSQGLRLPYEPRRIEAGGMAAPPPVISLEESA